VWSNHALRHPLGEPSEVTPAPIERLAVLIRRLCRLTLPAQ
jgi:hypothetical protein